MSRSFFLLFLLSAPIAEAGVFDDGKITGYDLSYCLPLNFGGKGTDTVNASVGLGLGATYYKEDSKFWYGTRKEWDFCAGKFVGLHAGDKTDLATGETVYVYGGDFYEFSYLPIGGTLLPGKYFTPGLIWIPSIYAGIGLTGAMQVARKIEFVSISNELQLESTGPTRYIGLIGPSLNLGAQWRLYLLDFFGSVRFNYYLGAPSEFSGNGMTVMVGVGISLVN